MTPEELKKQRQLVQDPSLFEKFIADLPFSLATSKAVTERFYC